MLPNRPESHDVPINRPCRPTRRSQSPIRTTPLFHIRTDPRAAPSTPATASCEERETRGRRHRVANQPRRPSTRTPRCRSRKRRSKGNRSEPSITAVRMASKRMHWQTLLSSQSFPSRRSETAARVPPGKAPPPSEETILPISAARSPRLSSLETPIVRRPGSMATGLR